MPDHDDTISQPPAAARLHGVDPSDGSGPAVSTVEAQRFFGPYELKRPLGAGGSGQVYSAWRRTAVGSPMVCVLKFPLQRHLNSAKARERLEAEARLALQLGNHPNIVQILDVQEHHGMMFIVMAYVDGCTLHDWLEHRRHRGKKLQLGTIYTLLDHIAMGLRHAHSRATIGGRPIRVVHRDIKPANVMMTRDGFAKIADFGTAVAADTENSGQHAYGTFRYMSPEHTECKVDPAMDMYSFGVLAWEVVENRRYRDGVEGIAHWGHIQKGNVPAFRDRSTPKALRTLIRSCLHTDPHDRPTAAAFVRALRQCPKFSTDPSMVESELVDYLGARRTSGATRGEFAASTELVATVAALEHARGLSDRKRFGASDDRETNSAPPPTVAPREPRGHTVRVRPSSKISEPTPTSLLGFDPPSPTDDDETTIRRPTPMEAGGAAVLTFEDDDQTTVEVPGRLTTAPSRRWRALVVGGMAAACLGVLWQWAWVPATRVADEPSVASVGHAAGLPRSAASGPAESVADASVEPPAGDPPRVFASAPDVSAASAPSASLSSDLDSPSETTAPTLDDEPQPDETAPPEVPPAEPSPPEVDLPPPAAPKPKQPRKSKPLTRDERRLLALAEYKRRPTAVLQSFAVDKAEVEIGGTAYVVGGKNGEVRPVPGNHRIRWRVDRDGPWSKGPRFRFKEHTRYVVRVYQTKQPEVIVLGPAEH